MKTSFRSAKTGVIAALLQNDQLSRLELSERAEVSPAAITEVTQTLLQQGLLLETPASVSGRRRGRPTVQLSLDATHSCFVGLSISEDRASLAITDLRGAVLGSETLEACATAADLPKLVRSSFSRVLRIANVARSRVRGVGIGVAGMVDADAGVCRYSAGLNWRDVPVAEMITQALGLQAWVDNDANAIAMREKMFGRAREYDNFSSVVLGPTIGSAHYMNGMLYRGHNGSAGEIGHITVDPGGRLCRCGRHGCLDTVAGGYTLRQRAQELGFAGNSLRDLEALAVQGESAAVHLLRNAGKALGDAIAMLVHLNNPKAVLFTDMAGFGNGIFRTATRQAVENGILPRFLGSTELLFHDAEPESLPRSAASIAAFNYLVSL